MSATPAACMRRAIVLFLLFLLPLEVLAGVVYEPALDHGTQAESTWFLSTPSIVVHDMPEAADPLSSDATPGLSLDLGEASDIVARLLQASRRAASFPPRQAIEIVRSVYPPVPIPPAIFLPPRVT